ncbi:hypothetical protein PoB_003562400 [Plakobranchus ocellatus]|uniref:Uncharacterized protein n=1 Tax=Plakobranchus ocellatus TaxID=259542 RepID=A0AAV4ASN3_9GAST|nr:hypothetical protein PoB_003562400 [Plakobranchus ocellatus]
MARQLDEGALVLFKVRETRAPVNESVRGWFGFLYIASPQHSDLRLSGPLSGQGAGGRARTPDRRVPADLRADSLSTVPSKLPECV